VKMREFNILSLGAGVQSTALYLMFMEGALKPALDYAIFADTGEEPEAVYAHLAWVQSLGGPPILVRQKSRLGDDLVKGTNSTGGRFASIPAFTAKEEGKPGGMVRRQCSKEYKIEVIERCIRRDIVGNKPRQRMPKDVKIVTSIGISLEEAGRAFRMKRNRERPWQELRFPLIDRAMTRADCLNWMASRVPHRVMRSACVFCPYHSDSEWQCVKDNPKDWGRAVEIDCALRTPGVAAARNLVSKLYLHRSCRPLEEVVFKPRNERELQLGLNFVSECEGVCGV
ncbi:hypothetical protein LCGC14_2851880, partial [marine sediment metagenome]